MHRPGIHSLHLHPGRAPCPAASPVPLLGSRKRRGGRDRAPGVARPQWPRGRNGPGCVPSAELPGVIFPGRAPRRCGGQAPAGWAGVGTLVHMQMCSVDPLNLQLPGRGGRAERWDFCWPRGNAEGVLSCIHHSANKRLLSTGLSSGPPHPLGRAPEVPAWPALPARPVSDLAASCPVMPLPWPLWPSCSSSPAPRPGPFSPPLHSALSI